MIKYLAPRFGNRVQEEDDDSLTALLLVAEMGHFEVARWLIDDLKMDPQDKDKVCVCGGGGGGVARKERKESTMQDLHGFCVCCVYVVHCML